MHITGIQNYRFERQSQITNKKQNEHKPQSCSIQNSENRIFAYKDFNINFTGRTPENFYEQEFNRKNMPISMLEYLNYDYEERCHIPPEQMMKEVFKYIEIADNLKDVKEIYPNETLFQSLHENHQNNRSSILAEIKMAKDLSDEPLFKDGSDNLGIYLLRKIYLEGKTVKEINKDFYEKDMNDTYKGIISRPIDSSTTSAYGIQYPKSAFWHSFIATREEYRKFFITLPKNSVNPAINIKQKEQENRTSDIHTPYQPSIKPRKRTYKLKPYQKRLITLDIKDAKGNIVEVEKKIKKRFAKDDPEASFIIKYLSPIMTVAADRVHLSEEMKYFCELERTEGKQGNEETMFGRFWKKNPEVLDDYAKTITDTIDLFEDVYAEGGLIPINKDLEPITEKTENKKTVDKVSAEFLELLEYTQTIMPEREKRYAEHEINQKLWEEHFIFRYGEPRNEIAETPEIQNIETGRIKESKEINELQNIHKMFFTTVKEVSNIYPRDYRNGYIKYILNHPEITEEDKKAYIYYVGKNKNIKDVEMSKDDLYEKMYPIEIDYISKNADFTRINNNISAKLAMLEVLSENGIQNPKTYTMNTFDFTYTDKERDTIYPILNKNQDRLNELYLQYKLPLKKKEVAAATEEMLKQIKNYEIGETSNEQTLAAVLYMMKEACNNPIREDLIKKLLKSVAEKYTYSKTILKDNEPQDIKRVKLENIMYAPVLEWILNKNNPILFTIIGEEAVQNHFQDIAPTMKLKVLEAIGKIPQNYREFYQLKSHDTTTIQNFQDFLKL